ncbi:MAG: hypothetical protein JWN38_1163 [Candidatus Saccharibacteria bacterium]|nr:hypothetical protein [Candidatus Saccharibacteria bacterium]
MKISKTSATDQTFPRGLSDIPNSPHTIFWKGRSPHELLSRPSVAIVGSRRMSAYGSAVTKQLATQLAEREIVIISGLALGIDALAHQAALEVGGSTIAVLPCSLHTIYPQTNAPIARQILAQDGALLSEYETDEAFSFKYSFVERNRIIAGLADLVIVTEAAKGSGSLHTASFAIEQGKPVFAVPGPINSPNSYGTNNLLKMPEAAPVTELNDILLALKMTPANSPPVRGRNPAEQVVLDLLRKGVEEGEALFHDSLLSIQSFNQTLTMLEITGKIRALGNNHWSLR